MTTLHLRETGTTDKGFTCELSFAGGPSYALTITDPFRNHPTYEELLEWYFEEWIRFPFVDRTLKQEAETRILEYGQQLFAQVFQADPDAYAEYCQLKSRLGQVQIEIAGKTPEFQALHWEAMQDPKWPRPLAVEAVMIRKNLKPQPVRVQVQPSPMLNLLVVTARPDEEKDVGYRTISRPLIEAIQTAQLRVNVEILRPATFEALAKHLAQPEKQNFYHIIHFDVHGALATHAQIQQGIEKDRYVYQMNYGQADLQPYEGKRAYLFFEGAAAGQANPVEATDLANLLTGAGIPVCILNACQSGKQVRQAVVGTTEAQRHGGEGAESLPTSETSLGSRLMGAGMQMVVAMGYSVTVSAAKLMMARVYGELFHQRGIAEALRLGRYDLFQDKQRKVYHNQLETLEDWLLPVVYANQTVALNLREFTPQEKEQDLLQRRRQFKFGGSEYGTEYGFVGRDLDILKLEKALLKHNSLLVQGMGGTGKTTLLRHLQEWWRVTQFAQQIFYFGYDERAWTVEQLVQAIGQRLYDRFDPFHGSIPEAREQQVIDSLRAQPHLLMLDNLESVTGQALAIQNTLPPAEQTKLRDFLLALQRGKTRVVLGSRSPEPWLERVYGANRYELRGLDPEAQTDLATKILERQVGDPQRVRELLQSDDLKRLLKVLAGYPLAMEVVLANLKHQTPAAILQSLDAADVRLDRDSADKTQSILKCVDYSHSRLSPNAQRLLLCLAPFSGFIDRADLDNYGNQLKQLPPFQDYDFSQFESAIQEAINWGLLAPHESGAPGLLTLQPVFPYFLKTRLSQEDPHLQTALLDGFAAHYRGLARQYYNLMESKQPQERQLGIAFCRWEYENLYRALCHSLEKQESISIFFCLDKYFELIQNPSENLKLAESVHQAVENYPEEFLQGDDGHQIMGAIDLLANCYLTSQDYVAARQAYLQELQVIETLRCLDTQQKALAQARTYHQLGIVAQEQRQWEEARAAYHQALAIYVEFNDRYEQAGTYHQLGRVAQETRQWEEARAAYHQALAIYVEFNDRYSQARTYHQLGIVAQETRQWEEARAAYHQALAIYVEFNDRYSQASTYHQLGRVAEEQRQWEAARAAYHQALAIKVEFNDRYEQAGTYHCLGMVAQETRQWEEARAAYHQALAIYVEFNDRYEQAGTYHNLGAVAQEMRQWEEARAAYHQALAIYVEFNDRYEQASTYHQLGTLAEEQGNYEEALPNLLTALEIYGAFNDQYNGGIVLRSIERVCQATQDEGLLAKIQEILNHRDTEAQSE